MLGEGIRVGRTGGGELAATTLLLEEGVLAGTGPGLVELGTGELELGELELGELEFGCAVTEVELRTVDETLAVAELVCA